MDDSPPGSSPLQAARLCRSAPAGSIVDLRNLLAERFPRQPLVARTRLSTGLEAVDRATAGGLPKGAITELITPKISAGSASLIVALLQAAEEGRYFLALIDGRDSFDPQPVGHACLRHLLWARCSQALEAIKAADLLLRDGNFPLVILDLVLNAGEELRKIPQTNWYRLQRLVEPTSTAFLVMSRQNMVASAQIKILLENAWARPTFEQENPLSRLHLRVQRSHLGQQLNSNAEAV